MNGRHNTYANDLWHEFQSRREQGINPRRALHDAVSAVRVYEVEPDGIVRIDPESREDVERLAREYLIAAGIDEPSDGSVLVVADRLQLALDRIANPTPPKPEVYEHYPLTRSMAVGAVRVKSLCGKVWVPDDGDAVVVGKCPTCEERVSKGWVS